MAPMTMGKLFLHIHGSETLNVWHAFKGANKQALIFSLMLQVSGAFGKDLQTSET